MGKLKVKRGERKSNRKQARSTKKANKKAEKQGRKDGRHKKKLQRKDKRQEVRKLRLNNRLEAKKAKFEAKAGKPSFGEQFKDAVSGIGGAVKGFFGGESVSSDAVSGFLGGGTSPADESGFGGVAGVQNSGARGFSAPDDFSDEGTDFSKRSSGKSDSSKQPSLFAEPLIYLGLIKDPRKK